MTLTGPIDREMASPKPPPRTVTVLAILAAVALLFSWIGAYALTNALVAAEVMIPWAPGHDPRPLRMAMLFVSLLGLFALAAVLFRWFSARQLRRLDALADAEDETTGE